MENHKVLKVGDLSRFRNEGEKTAQIGKYYICLDVLADGLCLAVFDWNTTNKTTDKGEFYDIKALKSWNEPIILCNLLVNPNPPPPTHPQNAYNDTWPKLLAYAHQLLSLEINTVAEMEPKNEVEFYASLNTILYGPPGTGKTYSLLDMAEQITGIRQLNGTQSTFTTFHQSVGYEQFIEGISATSEDGKLSYYIKPGLFKKACERAKADLENYKPHIEDEEDEEFEAMPNDFNEVEEDEQVEPSDELFPKSNSQKLTYEEIAELLSKEINDVLSQGKAYYFVTKENGHRQRVVEVSDNGQIKFTTNASRSDKKHTYSTNTEKLTRESFHKARRSGKSPINMVDYQIAANGMNGGSWRTTLAVVRRMVEIDRSDGNLEDSQVVIVEDAKLAEEVETTSSLTNSNQPPQHVFIIDEINRGNVAAIFGELITLIEDDKRLGMPNALTVTLPYSGAESEPFGIPPNLHIIGTMNTADRSVEALDTALRRRFRFEYMGPDPNLCPKDVGGVNVEKMLIAMNDRLELLLSRDHLVGHAWLMNCETLEQLVEAFDGKILPLLQEYFYNDYAKLQAVIGEAFVKEKENTSKIKLLGKDSDIIDFANDRKVFTLTSLKDVKDKEAQISALKAIYVE